MVLGMQQVIFCFMSSVPFNQLIALEEDNDLIQTRNAPFIILVFTIHPCSCSPPCINTFVCLSTLQFVLPTGIRANTFRVVRDREVNNYEF
jgi:hypothetical protein